VKPAWLTLTDHGDGTATLSGTPSNADVGAHPVVLRVTDAFTEQIFTITVAERPRYYIFLPLVLRNAPFSMVVVAVVSALLIIATTLKVKERPEFYQVDKPIPLGQAIRYTFTSRSFLILVAENFMVILMQALVMGSLFYLADYVLQMNTILVLVCVFIPLIAGVPLTSLIRRRFGVVGTQQLLLVIAGVALLLITVAPGPLILLCLALAGFGLAGPQTLSNVLFAQVADEDELRSGVRREGAFFGVNALLTKPAQSVALALIPFILETTHFVTREANQGRSSSTSRPAPFSAFAPSSG
jgi:GPH family glycoside/pentoside/hexuronide:cation symporter